VRSGPASLRPGEPDFGGRQAQDQPMADSRRFQILWLIPLAGALLAAPCAAQSSGESYLARAWKLGAKESLAITDVQLHRPIYVIVRTTSEVNQQPSSPVHPPQAPEDRDPTELKIQLSAKSELVSAENFRFLGTDNLRLWLAYTQQSHLQIFNVGNSSLFRENDFEPELILTYDNSGARSDLKLVNFGLLHQSNGEPRPDSRSWHRLYLQGGWEWGKLSLLARAWWRILEEATADDNPDITEYMGRGDLVLHWRPARDSTVGLLVRHNFRAGSGRGYGQLDWSTPLRWGRARVHVQASAGYGESLIDYNHKQATFGVGVSFGDW